MKRTDIVNIVIISCYFLFISISFFLAFNPGKAIGHNFFSFSVDMLKVLPCAFLLIGLFEVWVKT